MTDKDDEHDYLYRNEKVFEYLLLKHHVIL